MKNSLYGAGLSTIVVGGFCPAPFNIPVIGVGIGVIALEYYSRVSGGKYKNLFKSCGLTKDDTFPRFVSERERDYGKDLLFTLPMGMCSDDFIKQQQRLEQHFNADLEIEYVNNHILFKLKDKNQNHLYPYKYIDVKHLLELVVGINEDNKKIITLKLDHQKPHLLVAGETGGGKSVWMSQALANMIIYLSKQKYKNADINIVDFKGVDFTEFYECEYVKNIYHDLHEVDYLLSNLIKEMNIRYKALQNLKCKNIDTYNKKSKRKMKYIITFIDEFADITLNPNKDMKKRMINRVNELLRKARAVGIHLIIGLQRPDKDALPGAIKANISAKIAFKTVNSINSNVILDENGAENLRGKGHGILKFDKSQKFQGMFIEEGQVEKIIRDINKKNNSNQIKAEFVSKSNNIKYPNKQNNTELSQKTKGDFEL